MIEFLRIRNLALIDDMELEFSPGMNVLTGETGAGQRAGGTAWPGGEEQARLVDLAFQRDSRRYDRGFSLY